MGKIKINIQNTIYYNNKDINKIQLLFMKMDVLMVWKYVQVIKYP
jgi:hypothetical protein